MKGKEFIFIERITGWDEDRIICCDRDGNSRTVLTSWTDYLIDETLYVSKESVDFKFDDLQMLVKLISDIKKCNLNRVKM